MNNFRPCSTQCSLESGGPEKGGEREWSEGNEKEKKRIRDEKEERRAGTDGRKGIGER